MAKIAEARNSHPKAARTQEDARALKQAIEAFSSEYGRLPRIDSSDNEVRTNSAAGIDLLTILLAEENGSDAMQNPKKIPFASFKKVKSKKWGGLAYSDPRPGARPQGLYDVWGHPLRVIIRPPDATELVFTYGGKAVVLKDTVVAVVSAGPDGEEGNKDDIRTW
jgi:hypothetical protein